MFELRIDVYSSLYGIYKERLNRWECPPTKTSLYSFASTLFKHFFYKFYKALTLTWVAACIMCYSIWTCVVTLIELGMSPILIDAIAMFTVISLPLTAILFIFLRRIKMWHRQIPLNRQYIKISYRLGRFGEKLKKLLNPTVRFVGHPPSESEIERF